ncbi:hypothetical protein H0E87_015142 [Populus deltoides]|uniref:Uncharacterized protein n=1 Tax=Populus deltoides TaxID=3696 RepID=A0A8T2Y3W0_POPDE|nr:hypothetical protein H0E87_015142 [Populus deltoides]
MKISGEESVFTIYLLLGPLLVEERKFCPDWYKVSSSGVGWKDLEYWKVVLILEEILVFMTDQFILEPYFPDLFARQFGLCEDIPIPLLAIYNHQGISIGLLSPFEESINSRKPVLSYKEKNYDPIDTAPISLRTRGVSAPRDGIIKGTPGTLSPKVTSLPPTTEVIHLEKDALLEAAIAASLRTLTFPAFRIKLVEQVQKVTLVPMKV